MYLKQASQKTLCLILAAALSGVPSLLLAQEAPPRVPAPQAQQAPAAQPPAQTPAAPAQAAATAPAPEPTPQEKLLARVQEETLKIKRALVRALEKGFGRNTLVAGPQYGSRVEKEILELELKFVAWKAGVEEVLRIQSRNDSQIGVKRSLIGDYFSCLRDLLMARAFYSMPVGYDEWRRNLGLELNFDTLAEVTGYWALAGGLKSPQLLLTPVTDPEAEIVLDQRRIPVKELVRNEQAWEDPRFMLTLQLNDQFVAGILSHVAANELNQDSSIRTLKYLAAVTLFQNFSEINFVRNGPLEGIPGVPPSLAKEVPALRDYNSVSAELSKRKMELVKRGLLIKHFPLFSYKGSSLDQLWAFAQKKMKETNTPQKDNETFREIFTRTQGLSETEIYKIYGGVGKAEKAKLLFSTESFLKSLGQRLVAAKLEKAEQFAAAFESSVEDIQVGEEIDFHEKAVELIFRFPLSLGQNDSKALRNELRGLLAFARALSLSGVMGIIGLKLDEPVVVSAFQARQKELAAAISDEVIEEWIQKAHIESDAAIRAEARKDYIETLIKSSFELHKIEETPLEKLPVRIPLLAKALHPEIEKLGGSPSTQGMIANIIGAGAFGFDTARAVYTIVLTRLAQLYLGQEVQIKDGRIHAWVMPPFIEPFLPLPSGKFVFAPRETPTNKTTNVSVPIRGSAVTNLLASIQASSTNSAFNSFATNRVSTGPSTNSTPRKRVSSAQRKPPQFVWVPDPMEESVQNEIRYRAYKEWENTPMELKDVQDEIFDTRIDVKNTITQFQASLILQMAQIFRLGEILKLFAKRSDGSLVSGNVKLGELNLSSNQEKRYRDAYRNTLLNRSELSQDFGSLSFFGLFTVWEKTLASEIVAQLKGEAGFSPTSPLESHIRQVEPLVDRAIQNSMTAIRTNLQKLDQPYKGAKDLIDKGLLNPLLMTLMKSEYPGLEPEREALVDQLEAELSGDGVPERAMAKATGPLGFVGTLWLAFQASRIWAMYRPAGVVALGIQRTYQVLSPYFAGYVWATTPILLAQIELLRRDKNDSWHNYNVARQWFDSSTAGSSYYDHELLMKELARAKNATSQWRNQFLLPLAFVGLGGVAVTMKMLRTAQMFEEVGVLFKILVENKVLQEGEFIWDAKTLTDRVQLVTKGLRQQMNALIREKNLSEAGKQTGPRLAVKNAALEVSALRKKIASLENVQENCASTLQKIKDWRGRHGALWEALGITPQAAQYDSQFLLQTFQARMEHLMKLRGRSAIESEVAKMEAEARQAMTTLHTYIREVETPLFAQLDARLAQMGLTRQQALQSSAAEISAAAQRAVVELRFQLNEKLSALMSNVESAQTAPKVGTAVVPGLRELIASIENTQTQLLEFIAFHQQRVQAFLQNNQLHFDVLGIEKPFLDENLFMTINRSKDRIERQFRLAKTLGLPNYEVETLRLRAESAEASASVLKRQMMSDYFYITPSFPARLRNTRPFAWVLGKRNPLPYKSVTATEEAEAALGQGDEAPKGPQKITPRAETTFGPINRPRHSVVGKSFYDHFYQADRSILHEGRHAQADNYALFGLTEKATYAEVSQAYQAAVRAAANEFHGGPSERLLRIQEAFDEITALVARAEARRQGL